MAHNLFFTPPTGAASDDVFEQKILSGPSSASLTNGQRHTSNHVPATSSSWPESSVTVGHSEHARQQSSSRNRYLPANALAPGVQTLDELSTQRSNPPERKVKWRDLPKKGQLAILTLARLSEPLAERSLSAYIFYQIRSFDPSQSDSTITSRGGLLTAAFAGAQCFTAVWWGRAADSPRMGRKRVILIGLMGTAVATLGVGFSRNFATAIAWRLLAGALNGNVGVMRTMISEVIEDRKYQARAFLLLPMCFNIGVIIGPNLGGWFADPIKSYPNVFGPGSFLGGKNGVGWMTKFPYALPNIVSVTFISLSVLIVLFGLDETHYKLKDRQGWSRRMGRHLYRKLSLRAQAYDYEPVGSEDTDTDTYLMTSQKSTNQSNDHETGQSDQPSHGGQVHPAIRLLDTENGRAVVAPSKGFASILTSNILLTLICHFLVALHISSFNTLIFLFLPNPQVRSNPSSFSLRFSGGLGMSSSMVGAATSILGIIGLPLQIFYFPHLKGKLGTLRAYRTFLPFSAFAYILTPFLVLVQHKPYIMWPALTVILGAQVLSRTFVLPLTVILVNNSAPSAAVLGTVHGLAQTVSSAARTIGPYFGSLGLGWGLTSNCVGAVWWALAGVVVLNWSLLWVIWEGDGRGGRVND